MKRINTKLTRTYSFKYLFNMDAAEIFNKSKGELPLISVVVPVFNASKYLERCIESIIHQTYPHIEVIIVNDGSTDESELICLKYTERYEYIKYFYKQNGGLGSARNFGINNCNGDYIGFVDSDDWIDYDYFEGLFTLMSKHKAQITSYMLDITSKFRIHTNKSFGCNKVLKGTEIARYYFKQSLIDSNLFSVCSCLFLRSVIGENRFREGKLNEDMDFKFKALQRCSVWVVSYDKKYHYFQSGPSLSSGIVKEKDEDLFEASFLLLELAKKTNSKENYKNAEIGTIKPWFSILLRMAIWGAKPEVNVKKLIKEGIAKLRSNYWKLMTSPIKISRKFLITTFCINYKAAEFVLKLLSNFVR